MIKHIILPFLVLVSLFSNNIFAMDDDGPLSQVHSKSDEAPQIFKLSKYTAMFRHSNGTLEFHTHNGTKWSLAQVLDTNVNSIVVLDKSNIMTCGAPDRFANLKTWIQQNGGKWNKGVECFGMSSACKLGEDKAITGSRSGHLFVWEKFGDQWCKSSKKIKGLGSAVTCLCTDADGIVLSGYSDGGVQVWNTDNSNCLYSLQPAHSGPVIKISKQYGKYPLVRITISSQDDQAQDNRDITLNLENIQHDCTETICACELSDGRVISGSPYDKDLKIWDGQTGKLLKTIENAGGCHCLCRLGKKVLSGHSDGTVRAWNTGSDNSLDALLYVENDVAIKSISPFEETSETKFIVDGKTTCDLENGSITAIENSESLMQPSRAHRRSHAAKQKAQRLIGALVSRLKKFKKGIQRTGI